MSAERRIEPGDGATAVPLAAAWADVIAAEPARPGEQQCGARELHAEVEADLRDTGATMAEITSGMAFVDAQLRQINVSLDRLRRHRRQMNILAAVALVVVLVVALKAIAG